MLQQDEFTLKAYQELLRAATASGYKFTDFGNLEVKGPACLLRHDIDSELLNVTEMARLEAELEISSTYFLMMRSTSYNLFSIEGIRAVEDILKLGHSIGLHYMGELSAGWSLEKISEHVLREVSILEREFGANISSVSFHQPTKEILESNVQIGDLVNTYDRIRLKDYFYLSDSNMNWRRANPFDVFKNRLHDKIQLLIHPMWWTKSSMSLKSKWQNVLSYNMKIVLKHWQDRELTLKNINLSDNSEKD